MPRAGALRANRYLAVEALVCRPEKWRTVMMRLGRSSFSLSLFEAFRRYGRGPYSTAVVKAPMTRIIAPPNSR